MASWELMSLVDGNKTEVNWENLVERCLEREDGLQFPPKKKKIYIYQRSFKVLNKDMADCA